MTHRLRREERSAVFVLATLAVPAEVCSGDSGDWSKLWCTEVLAKLAAGLKVSRSLADAYIPMVISDQPYRDMTGAQRHQLAQPYKLLLKDAGISDLYAYLRVLVCIVEQERMDGKGMVLIRNLADLLCISSTDTIWLQNLLLNYLIAQQQQIAHTQEKKDNRYRYMKIGAMAVGAGAVIAFTAGLAAPAVAASLILMGTSAATAASVAGSMAMIFGGTGAGLAGYKMLVRTRGLTDFQFLQYDEKNRMGVAIMVSGWMEEPDDDKRTFGVPPDPDRMPLRERLTRYYRLHDPARLAGIAAECRTYDKDPEPLFSQLKEAYGKDPHEEASLVPPLQTPAVDAAGWYFALITECFESIAAEISEASTGAQQAPVGKEEDGGAVAQSVSEPLADGLSLTAVTAGALDQSEGELPVEASDTEPGEEVSTTAAATVSEVDAEDETEAAVEEEVENATAAVQAWDSELAAGQAGAAVHMADDFKYWHWREIALSLTHELTLLRWEEKLQRDLGKSILDLIKSLSTSAAEKVLQYTMMSALLAAVALPVALLGLLDVIDNIWTIAVERAEEAGKELARALLLRPQGRRPVTLVGYSLGCRVIFACLKELARHLPASDRNSAAGDTEGDEEYGESGKTEGDQDETTTEVRAEGEVPRGDASTTSSTAAAPAPRKLGLFGHAKALTSSVISVSGKIGGAVVKPVASLVQAKEKEVECALESKDLKSIVGDVVLLGAPVDLRDKSWSQVRGVVGGRLINGYSRKDMVLAVIYRYKQFKIGVSGLAPVKTAGVENINLTHIVTQHTHYCSKMKEILEEIDLTRPFYEAKAK